MQEISQKKRTSKKKVEDRDNLERKKMEERRGLKPRPSMMSQYHMKRADDEFQQWFCEFMQECHTTTRRLSVKEKFAKRNSFDLNPSTSGQQVPASGGPTDGEEGSAMATPIPPIPHPIAIPPTPHELPADCATFATVDNSPKNLSKHNLLSDDNFRLPKVNSGLSINSGFGSEARIGRSGRTSFSHSPVSPQSRLDRYIAHMTREELQHHLTKIARIGFEKYVGQDLGLKSGDADSSLNMTATLAENMISTETPEEELSNSLPIGTVFTVCGDHLEQTSKSISTEEIVQQFIPVSTSFSVPSNPISPGIQVENASTQRSASPASQLHTGTTNSPASEAFSLTRHVSAELRNAVQQQLQEDEDDDASSVAFHTRPFKKISRLVKERDFEGNKIINEYVVVADIGKGSFGKVKLAAHRDDPKDVVAIKVINRSLTKNTRRVSSAANDVDAQIRREIAIMKKLRHRNIVPLHAVIDDVTCDKLYLIMEYVPNGTLLQSEKDPDKREDASPLKRRWR